MRFFRQQRKNNIGLKMSYVAELMSKSYFEKFDLFHSSGDSLAFYMGDYIKVRNFAMDKFGLSEFDEISREQFIEAIREISPKIIRYFKDKSLASYELDIERFNVDGEISTIAGILANKERQHQNCFVIKDGECYMAPKIRPTPVSEIIEENELAFGINHSSMSLNGKVDYAGSFTYENVEGIGERWVIDNATGHYGTRPYHIMNALTKLKEKGMDFSNLVVKLYIPLDKEYKNFEEVYEPADELYERMTRDSFCRLC